MAKIEFKGIGQLSTVVESLVSIFADLAIGESASYKEAINLVHENASLTVHGQAMKKAIQDRITERALNSEVKEEMLSPTKNFLEGVVGSVGEKEERVICGCPGCQLHKANEKPEPSKVPRPTDRTSYIHFAFADSLDGRINFSTFIPGDRRYIGLYQDFKREDSMNPSDYTWRPIGVKGHFSTAWY